LTLLQGGQADEMSGIDRPRPCVVHGCERSGDHERVIKLGGNDVAAGFCANHMPDEADSSRPASATGEPEATAG